ncbi:MAG: EI24 domain-containing protein [Planctomycetes bacterium]|nr:EI24 domain-containing protein [Planctomycetota bacterium]
MSDTSPDAPGKQRCWRCGAATLPPPAECGRCGNTAPRPATAGSALGSAVSRGLASPLRGMAYVSRNPRLWSWIVLPLLLNALLFALIVWGLATYASDWMPDLSQSWPAWIDWLREATGWLLGVVLWTVAVLAGFFLTLLLSSIVNAPFYDMLSEAVESVHFGRKDPGRPWSAFVGDLLRSLRAALSLVLRQALVMALLFALSFTAVGAPLFVAAGFYYAGLGQVDVILSRKLYPAGRRTAWARRHILLVIALGVVVSFVPLLLPFGIVGSTLAFLDEPDKG